MKVKHNKKRNTAFLFEALVREITQALLSNNKDRSNIAKKIVREHFNKKTLLGSELDLYRSIYDSKCDDFYTAQRTLTETVSRYSSLDKKAVFNAQTKLINEINQTLGEKTFDNFVPNYKYIATINQLFTAGLKVSDKVLLERKVLTALLNKKQEPSVTLAPTDTLVFRTFIKKFNEEYGTSLNENQKKLLNKYIFSFLDNGIEFKLAINESYRDITNKLSGSLELNEIKNNQVATDKMHLVLHGIATDKIKELNEQTIKDLFKFYSLVEELEKNGN